MKKYKKDIKTIIEVLSFISLWCLIVFIDEPILAMISGLVFLIVWSWNIIDKINYRRGKYANQLRIPTNRDHYHQVTSWTLGSTILISSISWFLFAEGLKGLAVFGIIAGMLVLLNG